MSKLRAVILIPDDGTLDASDYRCAPDTEVRHVSRKLFDDIVKFIEHPETGVRLGRPERSSVKDDQHIIEFRLDGWTIQHPLSCRPNLFDCPVNRVAARDFVQVPESTGRFYCTLAEGQLVIGDAFKSH